MHAISRDLLSVVSKLIYSPLSKETYYDMLFVLFFSHAMSMTLFEGS